MRVFDLQIEFCATSVAFFSVQILALSSSAPVLVHSRARLGDAAISGPRIRRCERSMVNDILAGTSMWRTLTLIMKGRAFESRTSYVSSVAPIP